MLQIALLNGPWLASLHQQLYFHAGPSTFARFLNGSAGQCQKEPRPNAEP